MKYTVVTEEDQRVVIANTVYSQYGLAHGSGGKRGKDYGKCVGK